MSSLTFTAGVSVKDKLPFKNRFQDIHYCVVDYPVGKRIFWNSQWITGANSFSRMFEEWGRFLISSIVIAGFCTIAARCSSVARPARQSIFWRTYKKRLMWLLEVPDSKAASPELNQFMLEFEKGRLCGMTLYEILSLAINLAILILTTLSYLKNRKS